MIIIPVPTDKGALIQLGRQAEENAREIWFDLTYMITNYGEGEAELAYQRSKDGLPYPCVTTRQGNNLVWKPTKADLEYDGFGRAELRWNFGDGLSKTAIYRTNVLQSMTADADIPDPYESWYDQLLEQIGDSQGYAQQAAAAAQAADGYAEEAEAAKEAVLGTHVKISLSGNGTVTINGALEGGQ